MGADEEVSLNNLSLASDVYYGVKLDNRVIKTIYKDDLFLPTKALAVAIAEEWDSQVEQINLNDLYLNNLLCKAIRAEFDPEIQSYMRNEIALIFGNDEICYREDENSAN